MKRLLIISLIAFISIAAAASPNLGVGTSPNQGVGASAATDAERAQSYFRQGYLYYSENNYADAAPEFIKALKLDPKMAKAYYWLAKTNYKAGEYKRAIANCDAALSLDPKLPGVKDLQRSANAKLPAPKPVAAATASRAKVLPAPAEKTAKKRTITLDLRNVEISSVLQVFSSETGMNIIAGRDVYGKVTVMVKDMDPNEALDMILRSNGFQYTKEGNTIKVYSSGEPPRVEELPDGTFVRTFVINYIVAAELQDTLKKLMPETANIYTTGGSKTIVVKGSANDIRKAEILIRNLDIPPRQVMVEAKIVEVSLTESQHMGVNASHTNPENATEVVQTVGLAGGPTDATAVGLYYTITDASIPALLEVYANRTGFNILSSPKVLAMNDQKAEIITGSRLGYKVKTITTTGMVESVEFLDVGTKLVITPSIKSDGLIVMDIHPEISDGAIVNELPQKNSTETTTKLIVKDGQTIVIGGLVRDTSQKSVKGVPILMDLPILGMLFKRTELISEKKEVIILITPRILDAKLAAEMESKITEIEKARKDITPSMPLDLAK